MHLRIIEVPCFSDNYAYLVARGDRAEALVIDPSASGPVVAALEREGWTAAAVLATHHHGDHVGGIAELVARYPAISVAAHRSDRGRVPAQNVEVEHRGAIEMGGLEVVPLHVPGHTSGSVAYLIDDAVFTGDTLFVAGCGRLFGGTAEQMLESLAGTLARLPPETRVFCGHEYTVTNLRFALTVEPKNAATQAKLDWAEEQLSADRPTVPSTIAEELATNPFLRCAEPTLVERYGPGSTVDVFAAVRRAKDAF